MSTSPPSHVPPLLTFSPHGPLSGLERRLHVLEDGHERKPLWVLTAIAWVPFAILGLLDRISGRLSPELDHLGSHARLLLGIPLILLAELTLDLRARATAERLEATATVPREAEARLEHMLDTIAKIARSFVPELVLLVAAYAITVAGLLHALPAELLRWFAPTLHQAGSASTSSLSWWWFTLLAQPTFIFLFFRFVWHWLLWSGVLVGIARLPLRLQCAHPDHAGGLAFLADAFDSFRLFVLAGGVALASSWADELRDTQESPSTFAVYILRFLIFAIALGVAGYLPFSPKLLAAKRAGTHPYWAFAHDYVNRFERKWLSVAPPAEPDPLGAADIQSLADLEGTYDAVDQMRMTVFSTRSLTELVAFGVAPIIPIVASAVPAAKLIAKFLRFG
jgi:hypothetical protein